MKKLKVVLTLLLALCCSLCMFACGGGEKNISEIKLEGQKLNFQEGEEFSAEGLKVSVYYQGDDKLYELTAEEYEVDSSAYNPKEAGQYLIYVIPKNQPKELWDGTEGSKDNRMKQTYYATVDHSWHAAEPDSGFQEECKCGAKRNNYSDLEDQITTVGWGNPATLTRGGEGKTYPNAKDHITGENHVSYGSLVAGQSLTLTLDITDLTRNEDPTTANTYDCPLMGIRNGALGFIPREDGWIIGDAAGFSAPAESNVYGSNSPAAGIATKDSPLWQVMQDGTNWYAGSAFVDAETKSKWSTVVVQYDYQTDGVMHMRHTLKKFDGTETKLEISVNLPKAAYEVVVYGEFCNFKVSKVEFVAGLAIDTYEVEKNPTNTVQPQGKLFDTTGLETKATFSDGSDLDNNFNAYAYKYVRTVVQEPTDEKNEDDTDKMQDVTYYDKTRVNLATDTLQPDFFGFFVEFNGKSAYLSKDKTEIVAKDRLTEEEYTAEGFLAGLQKNDVITVIPTPVRGANATEIKVEGVSFEAPEVAYDYTVTSNTKTSAYIKLVATGTAAKATDAQSTALGGSTHFVAFKILTTLAAADVATEFNASANGVVVKAAKADATVDVVLGLKDGFEKTFDLNLAEGQKVQIDLSGLAELPKAGAEITETDFTLDAGGTYTVKYTGLSGTIDDLTLATGNARATVAKVKGDIGNSTYTAGTTDPTAGGFYRASNTLYIVGLKSDASSVTVTYWLAAPELVNLTSERMSTAVSIRSGETVLASANLVYNLKVSAQLKNTVNIGTESDPVYVVASGSRLLVYAFKETTNIADGANFQAILNVGHTRVEGQEYKMDYNVGVTIKGGAAAWLDGNDLTSGNSAAKLITVGTVNNTDDYDKGYILIASLNLPEIGVREGSAHRTDVFYFTANEDTVNGQDVYTIYKVGDEKNSVAITSTQQTVPSGDRTVLFPAGCLFDGTRAYETEYHFWYGAIITVATGDHTWTALEGVEGIQECSVCGTLTNYAHLTTNTAVEAANVTTPKLADEDGNALTALTVTFEVRNAEGDWASQALVTGEGNMIVTLPNLDPWNNTVTADLLDADGNVSIPKVEDATDPEKELAAKLSGGNCFPAADNLFNNAAWNTFLGDYFHVTITMSARNGIKYYKNGVLVVGYPADKTIGTGTVADFVELFLSLASRYGVIMNRSGAPMANFMVMPLEANQAKVDKYYATYVEKMGVPEMPRVATALPEKPTAEQGLLTETPADTTVTVGTDGTQEGTAWTGYSIGKTWYIEKGSKVVITGEMKVDAENDTNWGGVGVIFDRGLLQEGKIPQNGRLDYYVNNTQYSDINTLSVVTYAVSAVDAEGNGYPDWVASLKQIRQGNNTTVYTFDFTDPTKLVCSIQITGKEGNALAKDAVFTMTYTVTAHNKAVEIDGETPYSLDDWYLIGLAVDSGYFTGTIAVTPAQA